MVERTEWTPAPPPPSLNENSRSNWPRHPTLGPLSNRKIAEYAREGRYGPTIRNIELAKQHRVMVNRLGVIIRCGCGAEAVAFMRFGYLPKSGYYCTLCREKYRADAEKEKGERKRWLEKVKQEYV